MDNIFVIMDIPNTEVFSFSIYHIEMLDQVISSIHNYLINCMEPFVTYNYKITMFMDNGPNHIITLQPRLEGPDDRLRFLNTYVRFCCSRLNAHNGQYRNLLIAFKRASDESDLD